MGIEVSSGKKHKIVVQAAISVNVGMHLSLHRDDEKAPDPALALDGKKDNAERRRKPPLMWEGAKVEIEGKAISATTDKKGNCKLPVAGLADGDYVLVITPDPKQDAAPLVPKGSPLVRKQPSPARLVAPDDVEFAYRGTRVAISIQGEKLKTHPRIAVADHKHARVLKGATPTSLEIDLKPDWVRDKDAKKRKDPLDLVVIHHTGGNNMPGDLATFTSSNKSIHYLMDLDGHIIKMVNDGDNSVHAGRSRWAGADNVNGRSIGIEIVNGGATTEYTPEQKEAIVELVDQILTAQSLARHHVVGHEDIGTGDDNQPTSTVPLTQVGRKGSDPGAMFPWQLLEARGMGLQLTNPAPDDKTMYAGVFAKSKIMPRKAGPHVIELRQDLDAIGYSLNNNTSDQYDDHVGAAVFAFQRHFRTLDRKKKLTNDEPDLSFGNVDIRTAREIKRCTRWT